MREDLAMQGQKLDRLRHAEQEVAAALTALDGFRRGHRSPSERRARYAAVTTTLDAAIAVAEVAGAPQRHRLHRLLTQRELLVLEALSTPGTRPATCRRTTSREGTGPHIAGMHLDPIPAYGPVETRTYGLDLLAVLDGVPVLETTPPAPVPLAPVHELSVQRRPQRQAALAG